MIWLRKLAFPASTRLRTWKKLSAQTKYGVGLERSIRLLRDRAAGRKLNTLAGVYSHVLSQLSAGRTLDLALADFATSEEVMLIGGGQESGNISEGFNLAIRLLEARARIRQVLFESLSYPCLLCVLSVILLFVISFVVVPEMALMSDPATWSGASRALYLLAAFVTSPTGIGVFLVLVLGFLAMLISLPLWTGKLRRLADRLPLWSFYRLTTGTGWLFGVSTLMSAGKGLTQLLNSQIDSETTSPYLRERIWAVSEYCSRGRNLGEAMYQCGLQWPDPELVDDLRVYAELPGFHSQLHELAEEWLETGISRIQGQAKLLKAIFMGIVGAFVILLVFAMFSFQMQFATVRGY